MDLSFLDALQLWLQDHGHWLGPVIALAAFAESLVALGLLLPGVAILFALAVLAGSGLLEPLPMLIWAYIGAALGDGISFLIGYRFQGKIKGWWPFVRHPGWLEKGEDFFHRYGVQSIILGRFIGPIRPVLPVVAGMMDMSPRRFYTVNLLSAIPWALLYMMPGYLAGSALELSDQLPMESLWVFVALLVAAFAWAYFIFNLDLYLSRLYSSLLVPVLLLMLSNFGLILVTALEVSDQLKVSDLTIQQWVYDYSSPLLTQFFSWLTWVGSLATLWLPFAVLLMAYWMGRRVQKFYLAMIGFVGMEITLRVMKWSIDKPRPTSMEVLDPFSFSSGHTAQVAYVFLLFGLFFSRKLKPLPRVTFYGFINTVILLVAVSRLVLDMHWLSDVIAGLLLGVLWVSIVMLLDRFQAGESR